MQPSSKPRAVTSPLATSMPRAPVPPTRKSALLVVLLVVVDGNIVVIC
jgi:hypothetical protein